jgi:hypothetical protein
MPKTKGDNATRKSASQPEVIRRRSRSPLDRDENDFIIK